MSDTNCKYCLSENVRKFGKYKGNQLYFCNSCKRKFAPNDAQPPKISKPMPPITPKVGKLA